MHDAVHGHFGDAQVFKVSSDRGELRFVEFPAWSGDYKTPWGFNRNGDKDHLPAVEEEHVFPTVYDKKAYETILGFGINRASIKPGTSNVLIVSLPHWLPGLIAASLVTVLKTKPRQRFTLLNLLILVTCIAVVLGMFTALDRTTESYNRDLSWIESPGTIARCIG